MLDGSHASGTSLMSSVSASHTAVAKRPSPQSRVARTVTGYEPVSAASSACRPLGMARRASASRGVLPADRTAVVVVRHVVGVVSSSSVIEERKIAGPLLPVYQGRDPDG